jgi:hypothetical protein
MLKIDDMETCDELFSQAKKHVEVLRQSLISRIDPLQISTIAKVPYKALEIRETLAYRAADIGQAIVRTYEADLFVSSVILCRALQETLALLWYVNRACKRALENDSDTGLDETLMRVMVGFRDKGQGQENFPDAVNILTCIDRVERELEGFRKSYDQLSEYAHPNWSGVSGLFTQTDHENILVDLGSYISGKENIKLKISVSFATNLELLAMIYHQFADFLPELVQLCEREIERRNRTA